MKKKVFVIIILFFCFSIVNVKAYVFNNESILLKNEDYSGGSTEDVYKDGFVNTVESNNDFTCQTILIKANGEPTEFKKILDNLFNIMQILAPVITVVLSFIDYMKSLGTGDTKKTNIRTIKRIIIAVLIVFLPLLLDLLFHLFGLYDLSTCGIGK